MKKLEIQILLHWIRLKTSKKRLKQEKQTLENDYDKALKTTEKAQEIRNKIKFVKKAIKAIEKTKENIMDDTRRDIEIETNRLFFELLWDEDFKKIIIDKDYNLSVIHELDYECLDELSAAQREYSLYHLL